MIDAPKPKYWKALFVAALFTIPVSLFIRAFIHMSDMVWFVSLLVVTLLIAQTVLARMVNDWRAQDMIDLETFERRHQITRRIRR